MRTTEPVKVFIENREVPWEIVAPGMRRKIMAWDERLMVVKVEFEKGAVGTLHQHHHTQITHVENGIFEVEIETLDGDTQAPGAPLVPKIPAR